MIKSKKYLLIIDSIFLLGVLTIIFLLVGYTQPLVTGPIGLEEQPAIILPNVDYILLDNDLQFNSPKVFFIDDLISIDPGKHFIKISYGVKNEIRDLTTEVDVKLQLRRINNDSVGLFNVGDRALQIETYHVGSLINSSTAYTEGI